MGKVTRDTCTQKRPTTKDHFSIYISYCVNVHEWFFYVITFTRVYLLVCFGRRGPKSIRWHGDEDAKMEVEQGKENWQIRSDRGLRDGSPLFPGAAL